MKRSNLAVIVSTTIISLFLITGVAFSGDNIFPSSGNVGIGTTSPQQLLHIHNSGTGAYDYSWTAYTTGSTGSTSTDGLGIGVGWYNWGYIWNRENAGIIFGTYGTERMRITAAGNVGIRTTSPTEELEVAGGGDMILNDVNAGGNPSLTFQDEGVNIGRIYVEDDDTTLRLRGGDTTDAIIIKSNGNVGIRTTSPTEEFEVAGGGDMILNDVNAGGNPNLTFQDEGVNIGRIYVEDDDTTLRLRGGDTTDGIIINENGYVGIGTTTPDYKLDVFGTIRAKEVLVATGWYDFVFDDNYNLPSLAHVESYIEENNHLPDIPSAKEIQENGLSLAEIVGKQMQKIEELTLYVIEQNKQINELKDELAELKKTN